MKTLLTLSLGALIGLMIPLVCDWLMFGTLTPCRTVSSNNNVIIQECETR